MVRDKQAVNRQLRSILILSGLAGIEHKIKSLGIGADDYMTKPFHKDELIARIQAIVRRSTLRERPPSPSGVGSWQLPKRRLSI